MARQKSAEAIKAYSGEHFSEEGALLRIRQGLDAEWQSATDEPEQLE